jgi:metal-sulfur cluster biosynthetic enzyme
MSTVLYDTATTDVDSAIYTVLDGGTIHVKVNGTFDGCTVTGYIDFQDSSYCALQDAVWTAEDVKKVFVKAGETFKLTISSAGASTDIDAILL